MINTNGLSFLYIVKRLNYDDTDQIYKVYKNNKKYFSLLDIKPDIDSIKEDLEVLPKGKTSDDKCFLGYYMFDSLICVIDLIENYPNDKDAYIGLFMIDYLYQGKGIGTNIICELCSSLSKQGFTKIKLACLKNNILAHAFWTKNGFVTNGKTGRYKNIDTIELERNL